MMRWKKKNGLQLVRELLIGRAWERGSGEDIWDLLSALRGPDDDDVALKARTTWRLRVAIGGKFFGPCDIYLPPHINFLGASPDAPLGGESEENFLVRLCEELRKEFPSAPHHFLNHYAAACSTYWRLKGDK